MPCPLMNTREKSLTVLATVFCVLLGIKLNQGTMQAPDTGQSPKPSPISIEQSKKNEKSVSTEQEGNPFDSSRFPAANDSQLIFSRADSSVLDASLAGMNLSFAQE